MSQEPIKTKMFCDDRNTMNMIIEYATQKGFMSRCGENYHYSDNFTSVDEIVMMAKNEGLVIFYEDNGICYRLTSKGEDWYNENQITEETNGENKS